MAVEGEPDPDKNNDKGGKYGSVFIPAGDPGSLHLEVPACVPIS